MNIFFSSFPTIYVYKYLTLFNSYDINAINLSVLDCSRLNGIPKDAHERADKGAKCE